MLRTHFHSCYYSSRSTSIATTTTSPKTCTSTSTFSKIITKSVTLQPNAAPVRCNRCNKGYQQKCSAGPKASSRDINWNCNKCAKILQKSNTANILTTMFHLNSHQLSREISSQSYNETSIDSAQNSLKCATD